MDMDLIGGGGGYYGGGGSISRDWYSGSRYDPGLATGGSSYISGHAGCVAITSAEDRTPLGVEGTNNVDISIHYSKKYFTETVMIDADRYNWTYVKGEQLETVPAPNGEENYLGNVENGIAKIEFLY